MKIFDWIRRYKWDLAIALEVEGHRYDSPKWNFHIVKAPRNKWYADPFILDVTNNDIVVLVEEFTYSINRGRLAKLVIDKSTYRIKSEKIILDLSTHLSFPAILRLGDNIYIYPENSASGKSTLYCYTYQDDSLVVVDTLSELPLTDAIMAEVDGEDYMFATKIPTQNSNILTIYASEKKIGLYRPIQTIALADNTARSAGNVFIDGNRVIRPAQNCNGGYGVGLVFQEVIKKDNGKFVLKELFRKNPLRGYIGMHTYNQYKGYAIVDLHTRRHPLLHKILQSVKKGCNWRR